MTDPASDPTTAAIMEQLKERDQLRGETSRLREALAAALADVMRVTADRDHLRAEAAQRGNAMFVEGYDQAVREIRDHFGKQRQPKVSAVIEKIWIKESNT
jgi:regulator of replication initiation timing